MYLERDISYGSITMRFMKELAVSFTIFLFCLSQLNLPVYADDIPAPAETTASQEVVSTTDSSSTDTSTDASTDTSTDTSSTDTQTQENTTSDTGIAENTTSDTGTTESSETVLPVQTDTGNVGVGAGNVNTGTTTNTDTIPNKTIVWIQDGRFQIDNTSVNVTLKKDSDSQVREVQLQETATATTDMGVTIIIPVDTKIFSPTESIPVSEPTNDATQGVTQELISSSFEGEITEQPAVVNEQPENSIETQVATEDVTPSADISGTENQDTTSTTQEESTSSDSSSVNNESSQNVILPTPQESSVQGQAPLQGNGLIVENNTTDVAATGTQWVMQKTFTFGIEDQHLIFTKPVEIRVQLDGHQDGDAIALRVKHAGDEDFSSQ